LKEAGATPYIPDAATLPQLAEAAQRCRGCDLYKNATQAVLGEGPPGAPIAMIGEQPGDREDLAGKPFVGPAGALLDRALGDAGIARADVYVTNAVKHFKFEERGKRRIHKKPSTVEVHACHPWLEAELGLVTAPDRLPGGYGGICRDRQKAQVAGAARPVFRTPDGRGSHRHGPPFLDFAGGRRESPQAGL